MKEIKVFESKLVVGKLDYEELHNNIINCHNLLDIKKLYDIINKKYMIDKNIFFTGISIYEDFVYIITNINNKKKYIGETCNLISRMYSYSMISNISNEELKNDIINYGLINFTIEFIPTNSRKELEKEIIKKYDNNCYNISYTSKKKEINNKKSYIIGNKEFKSKKQIIDYCRTTLDSYPKDYEINMDSDLGIFVKSMIKLHINYDGFLDYSNNIKLSIIIDDEADAKGLGKWKIFCFEYTDNNNKIIKWGFSTNKIINKL